MLTRTPEEAARRIALSFLGEASAAARRLDDPADAEALHDFRVAVRRLRATARAYADQLDGVLGKKERKRLKTLQQATGPGRDAEVALEWLEPQRPGLREGHRLGFDTLADRLSTQKAACYERAKKKVRRDFEKLRKKLDHKLERMTVVVHLHDPTPPPTWAEELAEKARDAIDEVVADLERVRNEDDQGALTGVHDARIAMKRLRYLLEPARPYVQALRPLIKECKSLQDVLGEINDAHVLLELLDETVEDATRERAKRLHELALADDEERMRAEVRRTERPGFEEVRRRLVEREHTLMESVRNDWLDGGLATFAGHVRALADRLEALAERNVEVERKYLLKHLPEGVRGAKAKTIEQGWIPGNRLRERLRRIETPGGTKYVRTVKTGEGIERFEIEEETSSEVFDALWPLTEGCRVQKRRYDVADGDLTWEIDEFTDRELFLAEVELPTPDANPDLPDWLAEAVVEEVTGDPEYVNLNLAK
jgi:CHAD domain-containing protein/CYTH domain-containing protein